MKSDVDGAVAIVRFEAVTCDYSAPPVSKRYHDLETARQDAREYARNYGHRARLSILKDDELGRRWYGAESYDNTPRLCLS